MQTLSLPPGSAAQIDLPDAEVSYVASLPLREDPEVLLHILIEQTPWMTQDIVVWGKKYAQPRLTAWYADQGLTYSYSGIRLVPQAWTPTLLTIRTAVEATCAETFNSVLLNFYRDNRDSMGFHSDDEPELGTNPVIASVSLGETRTFLLKHRTRRDLKTVKIPLESGSLLLMKGPTQHCWVHGINKQSRVLGPRVNLTFRRILTG